MSDSAGLDWPSLEPRQARLQGILTDRRLHACLAGLGLEEVHAQASCDEDAAPACRLVLEHAAGQLCAYLTARPDSELAIVLGSAKTHPTLVRAALDEWFSPLLGPSGLRVSEAQWLEEPQSAAQLDALATLALPASMGTSRVLLGDVPAPLLGRLEARLRAASVPLDATLAALRVPGSLVIGRERVPQGLLASLRPGDVLISPGSHDARALLEPEAALEPARFAAYWGMPRGVRVHAAVAFERFSLTVMDEPSMDADDDYSSPDFRGEFSGEFTGETRQVPVAIERLDVPVQFEVATVTLPLARLSALSPGHVIELPQTPRDAQVRLLAYGQIVGYGELVTIGEHMGVRIVHMAAENGPV